MISALEEKAKRGRGGWKEGGQGAVFCRSFQSDFTNEMGKIMEPNESEATASMPTLPKLRHPGGLTLVVDHFISEVTDCTQRQKTAPCPPSFQPPQPPSCFLLQGAYKNRFP